MIGLPVREILIPIGASIRGDIHIELYNTKTGLVEASRDIRNIILNGYLNARFSATSVFGSAVDNFGFLSTSPWNQCKIGTSSQAAERTDTGIVGTTLATVNATTNTLASQGTYPMTRTIYFVFAAGVGTGTIAEMVIGVTTMAARQVISPVIEKTVLHELRVTWTITLGRGAASWSGTIVDGQRDGTTDINWVATINNNQIYRWASVPTAYSWTTGIYVRTGNSNVASDLVNDAEIALKGTQLFFGLPSLSTVDSYTNNTYYRDVTLGFEIGQTNGAISEMVLAPGSSYGLLRITFDPALDKVNTYRLYLKFRFQVVNMT